MSDYIMNLKVIKKIKHLLPVFMLMTATVYGQNGAATTLPRAFLVGEYEKEYAELMKQYPASLLSVSKDSLDLAYRNFMQLLYDIEQHAKKMDFKLGGIKIWLNVFWNKDGRIDYISYYPKPNCRNTDFRMLTAFFIHFIQNYKPKIKADTNFALYGSARFPSYAEKYIENSKNK